MNADLKVLARANQSALTAQQYLSKANGMSRQRKWQIEQKRNGRCTKCGKPAAIHLRGKRAGQTSVYCVEHLAKQWERNRAKTGLESWNKMSNRPFSKIAV
jgi:RNA polymerase-binding transcription factor DksA